MNGNASCFQYGCPTPPPGHVRGDLPHTGYDAALLLLVGLLFVAVGLLIRNRLDRRGA